MEIHWHLGTGHMIGYGIMAVAACALALSKPMGNNTALTYFDPALSGIIYIFMDPTFYIVGLIFGSEYLGLISRFGGLAALLISILLAFTFKNNKLFKAFYS